MELRVLFNGAQLEHRFEPTYLGVKLDCILSYGKHIDIRNNLLRNNVGCDSYSSTDSTSACLLVC